MSDDYFDESDIVTVHTMPDNILKLLECRSTIREVYCAGSDGINASKFIKIMDNILELELNTMYIDSIKTCKPIIDDYNKEQTKAANTKVIGLPVKAKE